MKFMDLFEVLQSKPETGIIVEDSETIYCQTLVNYLSVILYDKICSRYIEKVYVKDNNLHVVLEDEE